MPRFKLIVENDRDRWEEEYDEQVPDPRTWAIDTIKRFNGSLHPRELPRRLIDVIVIGESRVHKWGKSNLVTVMGRGVCYDTYRCEICGITGKRFGLDGDIKRDPKYKAKKYDNCYARKVCGEEKP
jgi:hypothetical protein